MGQQTSAAASPFPYAEVYLATEAAAGALAEAFVRASKQHGQDAFFHIFKSENAWGWKKEVDV